MKLLQTWQELALHFENLSWISSIQLPEHPVRIPSYQRSTQLETSKRGSDKEWKVLVGDRFQLKLQNVKRILQTLVVFLFD